MVDGAIQFTVDNGRGPITSLFKPENQFQFCNGDWHEIHGKKGKFWYLFCFGDTGHVVSERFFR